AAVAECRAQWRHPCLHRCAAGPGSERPGAGFQPPGTGTTGQCPDSGVEPMKHALSWFQQQSRRDQAALLLLALALGLYALLQGVVKPLQLAEANARLRLAAAEQ